MIHGSSRLNNTLDLVSRSAPITRRHTRFEDYRSENVR